MGRVTKARKPRRSGSHVTKAHKPRKKAGATRASARGQRQALQATSVARR